MSKSQKIVQNKPELKEKLSRRKIGNKYRLNKLGHGKKVINILTGEIFDSIRFAAKNSGLKYRTFHAQIKNENLNKTNFKLMA